MELNLANFNILKMKINYGKFNGSTEQNEPVKISYLLVIRRTLEFS